MLDLQELLRKCGIKSDELSPYLKKEKKRGSVWLAIFAIVCCVGVAGWFHQRIHRIEHKQKAIHRSIKMLEYGIASGPSLGKVPVPSRLAGIPYGEDLGVVLAVKSIDIRSVTAPYNPGLIKSASGYDLFFRYDVINPRLEYAPFSSRIGVVPLNHQFEQGDKEFKRIDLQTEYADDPRVLLIGDQLYLFCNLLNESNPKCRFMCAANLDQSSYAVNYSTILDMNLKWVEKNWSPFEYIGEDQKAHLLLEYQITPRKVLELPNPQVNEIKNVTLPSESAYFSLPWSEKWGEIRGGTPAVRIDDEYLGFFHSFFIDDNKLVWYVMGAYTFNAHPPFNITGISKYPILFKEIYETPFMNTASVGKRVVFPSGFVIEKQKGRELIHLACGENDCGVKIVTIDKDKLIKNMSRF